MFEALRERLLLIMLLCVAPSVMLLLFDIVIGDYEFFVFINQGLVNSVLDFVCVYASPACFLIFYSFILIKMLLSKTKSLVISGVSSLGTGLVAYIIGSLLKQLIKRHRPYESLSGVRVIGPWDTTSFSFPSTTTMLAFGFSLSILILSERRLYGVVLTALAYFIGFSVVYAGFHFPADVAAGIFISLMVVVFTCAGYSRLVRFIGRFMKNFESSDPCINTRI